MRHAITLGRLAAAWAAIQLAACAASGPAALAPARSWDELRGVRADPVLRAIGPADAVERRDGEQVYVYRRYRNVERPAMAPTITPGGQIVTPQAGRDIEFCETRIRVDARGILGPVIQAGTGCPELGPQPPALPR